MNTRLTRHAVTVLRYAAGLPTRTGEAITSADAVRAVVELVPLLGAAEAVPLARALADGITRQHAAQQDAAEHAQALLGYVLGDVEDPTLVEPAIGGLATWAQRVLGDGPDALATLARWQRRHGWRGLCVGCRQPRVLDPDGRCQACRAPDPADELDPHHPDPRIAQDRERLRGRGVLPLPG